MQSLNAIQLRGFVVRANLTEVDGKTLLRFTLATSRAFRRDGYTPPKETALFSCQAQESDKIPAETLKGIGKGSCVELSGFIKSRTDPDVYGIYRTRHTVIAKNLIVLEGPLKLDIH